MRFSKGHKGSLFIFFNFIKINFNVKKINQRFQRLDCKLTCWWGAGEGEKYFFFSSFSGVKVILLITKLLFSEFVKLKAF